MDRRQFLNTLPAFALLPSAYARFERYQPIDQEPPVQEPFLGNGPASFNLGVHNCGDGCAYERVLPGLDRVQPRWVRVTPHKLPPEPHDPMVVGLRDRGITPLYLLTGYDGRTPAPTEVLEHLEASVDTFPWISHVQFMNEPKNFNRIPPTTYVEKYLAPAREMVDRKNKERAVSRMDIRYPEDLATIRLVSAGWYGVDSGVGLTRDAIKAGMDDLVDAVGIHLYGRSGEAYENAKKYRAMTDRPLFVTETGHKKPEHHEQWYRNTMREIERIIGGPTWTHDGVTSEQPLFFYVWSDHKGFSLAEHPLKADGGCCDRVYTSGLGPWLEQRPR